MQFRMSRITCLSILVVGLVVPLATCSGKVCLVLTVWVRVCSMRVPLANSAYNTIILSFAGRKSRKPAICTRIHMIHGITLPCDVASACVGITSRYFQFGPHVDLHVCVWFGTASCTAVDN